MRVLPAVLIVLAACGGKPAATSTMARVDPVPAPGGEGAQPRGGGAAVAGCASRTHKLGP
jgi:hypothetical protein